jgi:plasmid stability protein
MGQILIRNVDDAVLADYREAAVHNQRSLEAELRAALVRAKPLTAAKRLHLLERLASIRAMTPDGIAQTSAEQLVREDRDGFRA